MIYFTFFKRKVALLLTFLNRRGGSFAESFFVKASDHRIAEVAPIFIIGAPRSGTTLTFQLIASAFDVGYFTNLHHHLFGIPAVVSFFTRKKTRTENFTSKYGQTSGLLGPSECGEWWYRFFRRSPAYVTNSDMTERSMQDFKRSLLSFSLAEKRPILFKNLYVGMRIEPIVTQFPNAIFIHVSRDIYDNAKSILEGRYQENKSYQPFWSVPPPGYETLLDFPPEDQVVGQITKITDLINSDIERLDFHSRVLTIEYEDLCQDTNKFLSEVSAFVLKVSGMDFQRTSDVPESFITTKKVELPNALDAALRHAVRKLKNNE